MTLKDDKATYGQSLRELGIFFGLEMFIELTKSVHCDADTVSSPRLEQVKG